MLAAAAMVLPKSSICSHVKGKSMNEIARVHLLCCSELASNACAQRDPTPKPTVASKPASDPSPKPTYRKNTTNLAAGALDHGRATTKAVRPRPKMTNHFALYAAYRIR